MAEKDKEAARWTAVTSLLSSDDEGDRQPAITAARPPDELTAGSARASFASLQAPTSAGSSLQSAARRSIYPPVDLASLGATAPDRNSVAVSSSLTRSGQPRRIKPEPRASSSTSGGLATMSAARNGGRPAVLPKVEVKLEDEDEEIEIIGQSSRPGSSSASWQARTAAPADQRARRGVKAEGTRASLEDGVSLEVGHPQLVAGTSQPTGGGGDFRQNQANRLRSFGKLAALDDEITSIENQLEGLQQLLQSLHSERERLANSLTGPAAHSVSTRQVAAVGLGASGHAGSGISYTAGSFEWSVELLQTAKVVFGIVAFRLCQEGVCNAAMDARDVVAIMPTGGGKSLCYQLPALLSPGTTLVISPLLSLITDQILHLESHGIACAQLTGSVDQSEQRRVLRRLVGDVGQDPTKVGFRYWDKGKGDKQKQGRHKDGNGGRGKGNRGERGKGKGRAKQELDNDDIDHALLEDDDRVEPDESQVVDEREIKLLYVTPERIAKSKVLGSTLQKMHTAGSLARIVVDEAHCVSQVGHDFRPDYKKLGVLRALYPGVPITAVTATCSRKVLPDLLKTLGMRDATSPTHANREGSVLFTSPLYRPNLRYRVIPKSSKASDNITDLATFVEREHRDQSGIVYTLSKKDAEEVAVGLNEHGLKAGVYHADVADAEKQRLHRRWREGEVKIVVATIAFGLGIDKGDVRFVIHHSLSKTLDGYYQETGRAGRDGEEASCVLFYRAMDVSRMAGLTMGEAEGQRKLDDMTSFAQDLFTCRKILFGRYFTTSASLPSQAWAMEEDPCGHCDNCTRGEENVNLVDCTLAAWKICRVAQHVSSKNGRITLAGLADLVRGLGGGTFDTIGVEGKGERKRARLTNQREKIDLKAVCGGKLAMSREDTERLLVHLLLDENGGYLERSFSQTAYAVNTYVRASPRALRLSRLEEADLANSAISIECAFLAKAGKNKTAAARKPTAKRPVKGDAQTTSITAAPILELGSDDDSEIDQSYGESDHVVEDERFERAGPPRRNDRNASEDDGSDEAFDAPRKRAKRSQQSSAPPVLDDEVDVDEWEAFDQAALWESVVTPRQGLKQVISDGGGGGSIGVRTNAIEDDISEDEDEKGEAVKASRGGRRPRQNRTRQILSDDDDDRDDHDDGASDDGVIYI